MSLNYTEFFHSGSHFHSIFTQRKISFYTELRWEYHWATLSFFSLSGSHLSSIFTQCIIFYFLHWEKMRMSLSYTELFLSVVLIFTQYLLSVRFLFTLRQDENIAELHWAFSLSVALILAQYLLSVLSFISCTEKRWEYRWITLSFFLSGSHFHSIFTQCKISFYTEIFAA